MDIIKIAVVGMTGAILSIIIKTYKPEYAIHVVIATVLLLFLVILYKLSSVFSFLESIYSQINYGKIYFPVILKVLGVAYISDFVAQICRDAGEGAIANKIELAGKVLIFYLSLPVMLSVIELINKLLPS